MRYKIWRHNFTVKHGWARIYRKEQRLENESGSRTTSVRHSTHQHKSRGYLTLQFMLKSIYSMTGLEL